MMVPDPEEILAPIRAVRGSWDPVEPAPRDGDLSAVMALIRPTGG